MYCMTYLKRIAFSILGIIAFVLFYYAFEPKPKYTYKPHPLPATFDEFYAEKLAISKKKNALPKNEEKLIRYSNGKTPIAILYIHGYNASRAEGEYVIDKIADQFKANTYYLRLPGHGTNIDDQLAATMKDHLDTATDTLFMMEKLGEKVIVVGCSMGGGISTYLAATYPDKISGLVLASPFYSFTALLGKIQYYTPMHWLTKSLMKYRSNPNPVPPEEDNRTKYWYQKTYVASLKQVIDIGKFSGDEKFVKKVKAPVLLLYYYKNKKNQDQVASVVAMLKNFSLFGTGATQNQLNRSVAIANGRHVLLSKYEISDNDLAEKEIADFIKKIANVR